MLEDDGYEVMPIADPTKVQEMQGKLPDLLLLDIWMAGRDGTSICKQLKSQPTTRTLPIILCSANYDTAQIAKECGADDSIAKPFDIAELLTKVNKYVHWRD